jgi:hypothetical protein
LNVDAAACAALNVAHQTPLGIDAPQPVRLHFTPSIERPPEIVARSPVYDVIVKCESAPLRSSVSRTWYTPARSSIAALVAAVPLAPARLLRTMARAAPIVLRGAPTVPAAASEPVGETTTVIAAATARPAIGAAAPLRTPS